MKHVIYGSLASIALFLAYLGILTVLESFSHALQQFVQLWYLMVPLIIGFGIQVGLFTYVREGIKALSIMGASSSVAASGGVSAGSMVLCCLHHVTDVLPLIGLSAAAILLTQFQGFFLVMGILSNIVGIIMMLNIMQKSSLHPKSGLFSGIFRLDLRGARNTAIISSVIILAVLFVFTLFMSPGTASQPIGYSPGDNPASDQLQTIYNDGNGVSIDATPVDFRFGDEIVFEIGINTHTVELGYRLEDISVLVNSEGDEFRPVRWEGSAPGGHHRSGRLVFPPIGETNRMKLIIKGVANVNERTFEWNL